jgi:putative transposase
MIAGMARPLRIAFPGALYHVTSRGNARADILRDQHDFTHILALLRAAVERYKWLIHSYCLMPNHYHLMVETPRANLSDGMHYINGCHAQRFNRKYDHVGHVIQGRYKAILVDKETYLLELCRYIVLNPVRAGLVTKPGEWRWSSYNTTTGEAPNPGFLSTHWILSEFDKDTAKARKAYRRFVADGINVGSPWSEMRGEILLGNSAFIEKMKPIFEAQGSSGVFRRVERYATRPPLASIFDGIPRRPLHIGKIRIAHSRYAYTLREIADFHNVTPTAVRKALQKARCSTG